MMNEGRKRPSVGPTTGLRRLCGHCDQWLTVPVYKRHRKNFFSPTTSTWQRVVETTSSESDSEAGLHGAGSDYMLEGIGSFLVCIIYYRCGMCIKFLIPTDYGFQTDDNEMQVYTGENEQEFDNTQGPEVWDLDDRELLEDFNPAFTTVGQNTNDTALTKTVRWVLLFLLLWASFHSISANAIDHLIHFLHYLFSSLSQYSAFIVSLGAAFPPSYYLAKKYFALDKDRFTRFVVCPGCHSLYHFKDCYECIGSRLVPKTCPYVAFPNHPHTSRRKPCSHRIVKEVKCRDGSIKLYPLKVYCYKSVKESLECMVKRKGFLDMCELWRKRSIPQGYLADIYDGKVWQDFMNVNGQPFLSQPYNLGFMLNIDWFQPFKHTQYSLGVIYMVILNLPRSVRFKRENILIIGLIPGPSEPPHDINSYLSPLVQDLLELWERGISLTYCGKEVTVHTALLCLACDVPAARKTGGFLSHSARQGCSKCTKTFTYDKDQQRTNFSGFDLCPPRSHAQHVASAQESRQANTQAEREAKEKESGSRYSELMRLPYFDCVRFTIIDPMHNLFLGTAKHVLKNIWLNEDDLKILRKTYSTYKIW